MARRTAIKEKNITRTVCETTATIECFDITKKAPVQIDIILDGKYNPDDEKDKDDMFFSAKTDTLIPYEVIKVKYFEQKYSMPISLFKAYATLVTDLSAPEE